MCCFIATRLHAPLESEACVSSGSACCIEASFSDGDAEIFAGENDRVRVLLFALGFLRRLLAEALEAFVTEANQLRHGARYTASQKELLEQWSSKLCVL